MLIPQSIDENKVKAYLNVDIEAKEFGIPSYAEKNKSIEFTIPSITWEKNKIYHYKIDLDMEHALGLLPVVIESAQIIDWADEDGFTIDEVKDENE